MLSLISDICTISISVTMLDRKKLSIDQLWEAAYCESNGHMTDDVTGFWKVKVVTQICWWLHWKRLVHIKRPVNELLGKYKLTACTPMGHTLWSRSFSKIWAIRRDRCSPMKKNAFVTFYHRDTRYYVIISHNSSDTMIGHLQSAIGTLTSHASWVWLDCREVRFFSDA